VHIDWLHEAFSFSRHNIPALYANQIASNIQIKRERLAASAFCCREVSDLSDIDFIIKPGCSGLSAAVKSGKINHIAFPC
jgi:hypothetical protein